MIIEKAAGIRRLLFVCPDLLRGAGYDILNVKGFNEPEGGKCQKTNILIRRFPA